MRGAKKKRETLHFASIFKVHMNYHKLGTYSLIGEDMEFHKRRRNIRRRRRIKKCCNNSVQEDDVDNEYEYDE